MTVTKGCFVAARFGVTRMSFLGCLRDVSLVSRGNEVQDLLSGSFVGIQPGCGSVSLLFL